MTIYERERKKGRKILSSFRLLLFFAFIFILPLVFFSLYTSLLVVGSNSSALFEVQVAI